MKCIKLKVLIVFILWIVTDINGLYLNRKQYIQDGVSEENNDNYDTSRYKFAYGVEDHKTGDFKMHQEERDGDLVKGEYTVADADGTLRTVRYTADKLNGFHAVISKGGSSRQEILPAPIAAPSYHPSIKVPSSLNHHSHQMHHHDHESMRDSDPSITHLPIKKYIYDLPQFAKQYAPKHNKIVERFNSDNAGHYQSVNIDGNTDRTHYEYNISQEKMKEERMKEEKAKEENARRLAKHLEVYGHQPVVFHMQTPQGFKKSDESLPVALPLTSHPMYEDGNEEDREKQGLSVEEPDWKQVNQQGRPLNSYRHGFETHFGKHRRPGKESDEGAYSYMNFEGDTKNGYELLHKTIKS